MNFSERLASAISAKKSPLVVGLDPRLERLPQVLKSLADGTIAEKAEAYRLFCNSVIDSVADLVPAVKPQFAFFEELGPDGLKALKSVTDYAAAQGLVVIGDGKRGDIGSTAIAYASAYLGRESVWGMDSLTVNPYLGRDSLQPFIEIARQQLAGLFFLVKTSNPGSGDLQDLNFGAEAGRKNIAEHVAGWLAEFARESLAIKSDVNGLSEIGAVVGATYPTELAKMRQILKGVWILIPGFGAQGGTAADTAAGFLPSGLGAVVNSSRGVIFAFDKSDATNQWTDAVRQAAIDANNQLRDNTPAGNL